MTLQIPTSQDVSSLAAGTYTVTVTNDNGYTTETETVTITEPTDFRFQVHKST